MKVNLPKDNGFQKKTPILTLVDNESSYRLTKANAVSFNLQVDPKKDDSQAADKLQLALSSWALARA